MKRFLCVFVLLLGDCAIFYASLAPALLLRQPQLFSAAYFWRHVYAFSSVFPIWLTVNFLIGLYDFAVLQDLPNLIGDCILAFFYNLLLSFAVFYLFSNQLMTPKTHLLLALGFASLAGFAWRRLWAHAVSLNFLAQRIVFLGNNPLMRKMAEDLGGRRRTRFRLISSYKLLRWHRNRSRTPAPDGPSLRSLVDIVVVAAEQIELNKDYRNEVISRAIAEDIPLWIHLDFYEELYKKISPELAARPTWLFNHVLHKKAEVYFAFKRLADILMSLVALVLSLPLLALIAFPIWALNGRPIFYSQKRLGYLGKEFIFWKFRTMLPGSEKLGYLWDVAKGDPRITRLGRWLRRYRLDELPQLWNILKGDMSFIGPRPTWIGEKQALQMANYHLRHLVKPGLTGWAQINARATDSLEDTVEKLHYDLYYVKHSSSSLDLAILLKTAKRVIHSEGYFNRRRQVL
jgi:exopolysaccharide biosynthesis polyprenyl glycosylphosphotransferase